MEIEIWKHGIKYRLRRMKFGPSTERYRATWLGHDGNTYQQWVTRYVPIAQRQRWKIVKAGCGTWIDSNARKSEVLKSRVWANHAVAEFRKGIHETSVTLPANRGGLARRCRDSSVYAIRPCPDLRLPDDLRHVALHRANRTGSV